MVNKTLRRRKLRALFALFGSVMSADHYETAFSFAYGGPMQLSEMIHLHVRDIDRDHMLIRVEPSFALFAARCVLTIELTTKANASNIHRQIPRLFAPSWGK